MRRKILLLIPIFDDLTRHRSGGWIDPILGPVYKGLFVADTTVFHLPVLIGRFSVCLLPVSRSANCGFLRYTGLGLESAG